MHRAYSYVRFSDRRQMGGDSLRRQVRLTEDYCERKGLHLDESLNLRDLGVSGFRGRNADVGALSVFLEAVKLKRVPAGSVLILENLDRLSRNDIDEALPLFMGILKAGVSVVTVRPEREYTAESTRGNIGSILEVVLAFALANDESRKKSERVLEEWRERFKRTSGEKITARVPCWLRLRPDRKSFEQIPHAVALVRRIFDMAEEGYGSATIARRLNAEGVPSIGRGGPWEGSYVRRILTHRAVLGEYQSYTGAGKNKRPYGPPVVDYFPAVITEAQFHAVQNGRQRRRTQAGPRGKGLANLFTGLLHDARDGGTLRIATRKRGKSSLVSSQAARGVRGTKYLSFPYQTFEGAVLSLLAEVRAKDILTPVSGTEVPDQVSLWSGKVTELEHKTAQTRERINREPDIGVYLDVLADLERQLREALAELDRAKRASTNSVSENVGEVHSLLDLLREASPEECESLRTRLRSKLAELIDCVWCLFVPTRMRGSRGRIFGARMACIQVYFRGKSSRHRDYIVLANLRTGRWRTWSLAEVAGPEDLDLRKRSDAKRLEKSLGQLDLDALE